METIEQSVSKPTQFRNVPWVKAATVAFQEKQEADRKERERVAENQLSFATNALMLFAESLGIPKEDFSVEIVPDLDQADTNETGVYDEDTKQYRRVVLQVNHFWLIRTGKAHYFAAEQNMKGEWWYGPIHDVEDLGAYLSDSLQPHPDSPALVEERVNAMDVADAQAKLIREAVESMGCRQVFALESIASHLSSVAASLAELSAPVDGNRFQVRTWGTED